MESVGNRVRRRARHVASGLALGAAMLLPGLAHAAAPIKIGVIAEVSTLPGAGIANAAKMAAAEINAKGGVNGRKIQIITYDDHVSSTDAVRAFQRAAKQDHVVAVIGSFISEVALALEPWAARLHMPYITPGAASNDISKAVHDNYARNKYTFHEWLTSAFLAQGVCDAAHDLLVKGFGMKTAVVMSEDAAWTTPLDAGYLACLPKAGLKVVDHIRFSPDTTDFTPIFNRIESKHPDVIITGISHVGVQPTVQWAAQQVPIPMFGVSSQATTSNFWKDTNGAALGVVAQNAAVPGTAITPKTQPFLNAYVKEFGATPPYCAYSTDDAVHIIANAIKADGGSTNPDKLVAAMEKTNYVGTIGRVQFYGRKDKFTHAMKFGWNYVDEIMMEWENGSQKAVWPKQFATTKITFPSFVKAKQASAN
ncbi:MAG TPA: ABC transporter substrate-binding protein [Acetobacteraceae bacterium]|nr:ABC transporter substrate-binding protein [Acetobacteraceae bacterium]